MSGLIDVGPWMPALRRKSRKLVVLQELEVMVLRVEDENERVRLQALADLVREL